MIKNGNTELFPSRFGRPKQLQNRSKPPWRRPEKLSFNSGFAVLADFKEVITCDQKRKYAIYLYELV